MSNPFEGRTPSLAGPALDLVPVTPDDNGDLPTAGVAFYATGAGDVAVVTASGASRVVPVTGYMIVPLGILRVLESGTTATGIQAFTLA